jgi:hypothetical protein
VRRVPPHKSASFPTGIKDIVARTPYRCAVGLMIKTDEVSEQLCTDVAMFETGRIFSRGSSYYYIGRFELSSDVLRGVPTVTFYAGPFSS